jgi:hypothetical protein
MYQFPLLKGLKNMHEPHVSMLFSVLSERINRSEFQHYCYMNSLYTRNFSFVTSISAPTKPMLYPD